MQKLTAILLALAATLSAKTVFVNNQTGADNNDGLSREKPLATLAKAAPLLAPGDVLDIAPGKTYHESLVMSVNGTPSQPIVIEGNGAVLSGLEPVPAQGWQDLGNGLFLNPNKRYSGALRPRVFNERSEMISISEKNPAKLKPGQALWNEKGIYMLTADGQSPANLPLFGFFKESGVIFTGQSYITVNNLTCENFANDGFNVHGYCRGLIFRNITARWNGDDGFSIHEDVMATVYGAHLHHNDFGIQDICLSRSFFFGLLIEDNRIVGADFIGGMRSLEDSVIRNNGQHQIRVSPGSADHMGIARNCPLFFPTVYLKNVLILGGPGAALRMNGPTQGTAINCTFLNTERGLELGPSSRLHLYSSVIANCKNLELAIDKGASFFSQANDFHPGRGQIGDATHEGDALLAALKDTTSSCAAPAFGDRYHAARPRLIANKRSIRPGFDSNIPLDFVPETPQELSLGAVPVVFKFDFEKENPWSRTYIEPDAEEKNVKHSSVLSSEQAASGRQSAKVEAVFPAAPKTKTYRLKLFSIRFDDVVRPVSFWTFKMYGKKDGSKYIIRVRDKYGEYFFGPSGVIDWEGWRTFTWDLTQQPPRTANGNGVQDLPPVELVIDFTITVPPEGKTFTTYVDDLEFR